ncbi:MAG: hypothetical protein JNK65_06230, partial [Deltaproteobacteria bacterium]|nr:hypothetical protein [Deltaproteobacteria bacterium]
AESKVFKKHFEIASLLSLSCFRVYQARLKKNPSIPFLLIETGIGPAASQKAAEYVFEHYSILEAWLFGLAGACKPDLKVGDLLIASMIANELLSEQNWIHCHPSAIELTKKLVQKMGLDSHTGSLVTIETVAHRPEEKLLLGNRFGFLGVEMEAFPIAQKAQSKHVSFQQIRWVLDRAEESLLNLDGMIDVQGRPLPFKMLFGFFKNPSKILEIPRLIHHVQKALHAMQLFAEKWLAERFQ